MSAASHLLVVGPSAANGWAFWIANGLCAAAIFPLAFQLPLALTFLCAGKPEVGRLLLHIYDAVGMAAGVPNMSFFYVFACLWPALIGLGALSWVQHMHVQRLVALFHIWYLGVAVIFAFGKVVALGKRRVDAHDTYLFDVFVAVSFGLRVALPDVFMLRGCLPLIGVWAGAVALIMVVLVIAIRVRKEGLESALKISMEVVNAMDAAAASRPPRGTSLWPVDAEYPLSYIPSEELERKADEEMKRARYTHPTVVIVMMLTLMASAVTVVGDNADAPTDDGSSRANMYFFVAVAPFDVLLGVFCSLKPLAKYQIAPAPAASGAELTPAPAAGVLVDAPSEGDAVREFAAPSAASEEVVEDIESPPRG